MIYKLNINVNIKKDYYIKSILSILYQRIIKVHNYKYLFGNIIQDIDFTIISNSNYLKNYNIFFYYILSIFNNNKENNSYINWIYTDTFDNYIIETNIEYKILCDYIKIIIDKHEFFIKNISPEYGNDWTITFTLSTNYLIY
jgi:hypothetical protein